jgi:hypothetical protein
MANTMTTYVKVCNLNEETFGKVKELFETEGENSSEVKVVENFNKLFGTEYIPSNFNPESESETLSETFHS